MCALIMKTNKCTQFYLNQRHTFKIVPLLILFKGKLQEWLVEIFTNNLWTLFVTICFKCPQEANQVLLWGGGDEKILGLFRELYFEICMLNNVIEAHKTVILHEHLF